MEDVDRFKRMHDGLFEASKSADIEVIDLVAFLMAEIAGVMILGDVPEEVFDGICKQIKKQYTKHGKKKGNNGDG